MRVLFTTFPIASHYFPMVPLAWALRNAGHSVRVACSPAYAPAVTGSGIPALPVGSDVDRSRIWRDFVPGTVEGRPTEQAAEWSARAMTMFRATAEAMTADLTRYARSWRPDLVVYEPRAYAGLILAERLGVPAVRHLWGTDFTHRRWPAEEPLLRPYFAASGLHAGDPFGALTVDPCPPSLQVGEVPNRLRMRYIPYNGAGTVPLWLAEPSPRPRVCLTWGTSPLAPGRFEAFLRLVDRIGKLDVEVVLAVSNADKVRGRVPAAVRVIESMPLHLLLPACSVLVHRGGSGATLTAIARGVPQYILPAVADGQLNGELLARRGAALTADVDEIGPDDFADGVAALVHDEGFRRVTGELRAEMDRQPAPAAVVAALEQWA